MKSRQLSDREVLTVCLVKYMFKCENFYKRVHITISILTLSLTLDIFNLDVFPVDLCSVNYFLFPITLLSSLSDLHAGTN